FAAIAGGDPHGGDFALGALGGVLNVAALGCLYQGLAVGRAGLVAPVAAVVGSVIPVAWGLASGEDPTTAALIGVVLAVVAGGLISAEGGEHPTSRVGNRSALVLALLAGVGFGLSFVCYGNTRDASEFWPVFSGRVAAVIAVVVVAAVLHISPRLDRVARTQAIGAGALDVLATALLLVAVRNGLFSTVAPVAALGPAFTVGHAWWHLKEQPSRIQIAGLVIAVTGLALIAVGASS
ncbi:MAG TPA: EamA family transporter, partial [Acidimicrobiia bacterium]|nr:EamA family transporter [Acidimicrobiia bacterium]